MINKLVTPATARKLVAAVLCGLLLVAGAVAFGGCRRAARLEAAQTRASLESVESVLDELDDVLQQLESVDEADLGF